MRRLLPRAFNGAAAVSLLLLVATCGLWLAAQQVQRQFAWHRLSLDGAAVCERTVWFGWDRAGVGLVTEDACHLSGHGPPDRFGRVARPVPPPADEDLRRARERFEAWRRVSPAPVVIGGGHPGYEDWHGDFFPEDEAGHDLASHTRIRRATAPFYLLAAALGLPALAAGAVRLWRRAPRRRRRPGSCPSCGYDLRATPEEGGVLFNRCPECGSERAVRSSDSRWSGA